MEDAINRIVKRTAVLAAAAAFSLGALAVSSATAAPQGAQTAQTAQAPDNVYPVPNLNYCHAVMNTDWQPTRQVQVAVNADNPTGVAVTCTAQLYTYQTGPTGPSYTVANGAGAQGGWVADSTAGSYNYVCVSEMDINLASNHLAASYAGCGLLY
ncbi:hypothetical protein [Kitasatospora mediocidica]|uniref:hypothetical protein n=1 Tax=Kitasatospora mediocidica TaxID=58352 RepID=UPI00055B2590|nr:hypothetical protein [Kitasatospora mediocidica]